MDEIQLKSKAVRIFNMADTMDAQMKILETELPVNSREFYIVKSLVMFLQQSPRSSDEINNYLTTLLD